MVLHFFCYILITFLMLSVTLLSMLMILFPALSMIRHLISGNNYNWLLNKSLIYKTLWMRVFPIGEGWGECPPPVKNFVTPPPLPQVDSPPPNFYPSLPPPPPLHKRLIPPPLNNNFQVITQ